MNHAQRELHEEQGQVSQVPLPRSAARVLAACAMSPSLFRDFPFRDALAEGLLDSLSLDPRLFAEEELRPTAFRALVMDLSVAGNSRTSSERPLGRRRSTGDRALALAVLAAARRSRASRGLPV